MSTPTLNITLEDEGRIAVLRLEHGKANEMGSAQLIELEALVESLSRPDGPRALITYSTKTSSRGTPIFVAGANVTERTGWDDDRVRTHVRWQRSVLASLRRAPVFHVAVVSGVALGWGTEFLLTADWRIATDRSVFGLPETTLGIVPGAGGTSELWTEIGLGHALRLGMTGERIGPGEAARIGLVHESLPDLDDGLARARILAKKAIMASPTAVAAFKQAVLSCVGQDAAARQEIEARAYAHSVVMGQAAIGRASFAQIRAGEPVEWGPRVLRTDGETS